MPAELSNVSQDELLQPLNCSACQSFGIDSSVKSLCLAIDGGQRYRHLEEVAEDAKILGFLAVRSHLINNA